MSKDPFRAEPEDIESIQTQVSEKLAERTFASEPLGVTDFCLTPTEILAMTDNGLSGTRLEHVMDCNVCFEQITGLAELQLQSPPGFVANALQKAGLRGGAETAKTQTAAEESHGRLAVLAIREGAFHIIDESKSLDFRCDVIPAFKVDIKHSKIAGLKISGALEAKDGQVEGMVDVTEDGSPDMMAIHFPHARLSSRVREGVHNKQTVVDTVVVTGYFVGDEKLRFTGQARLTFKPPAEKRKKEKKSKSAPEI